MDPIDLQIQKRLEKLKEKDQKQPIPSEDELYKRLRELKGLPATSSISNKYIIFPKPKSDQEQVDNLLKQFSEEINLSAGPSVCASADEIEKRLQNLKGECHQSSTRKVNDTPKESDTKGLLRKILAEAKLEKKTEEKFPKLIAEPGKTEQTDEHMDFSNSEDDFCSICEKYPKWICLNCDKDPFCNRCFKEFHDDIGECHQRKLFTRQRTQSSDSDYSE